MKKLLSILLTLSLLFVPLSPALAAEGVPASTEATVSSPLSTDSRTPPPIPTTGDVWDGSIEQPTTIVQRDGIAYYEITKCSQLAYVAQTGGKWASYNYILANNLILNDVVLTWDEEGNCTNTEPLLEWTPLYDTTGSFLGNGYTISGMYIEADYSLGPGVGFFGYKEAGMINGLIIVNSYVKNTASTHGDAAGLVGTIHSDDVINCVYSGAIKVEKGYGCNASGLIGSSLGSQIENCRNYADLFGRNCAGIVNDNAFLRVGISDCINYGNIYAAESAGGITTDIATDFTNCQNFGDIQGTSHVGGIAAKASRQSSPEIIGASNMGTISGNEYVGGILGGIEDGSYGHTDILNCSNYGVISGGSFVGGISGEAVYSNIEHCYSVGLISGDSSVGALVGDSDSIWGERSEITGCYYLKDILPESVISPFGNVSGDITGVAEGLTDAQMKEQASFVGWDFDQTWSIDPAKNGGYPYLSWQTPGDLPVKGVSLNKPSLSMAVGDQEYLAAVISPTNAADLNCSWRSSNEQVASVSQSGKVTALSPGTAEISVTTQDGDHTAMCGVTVSKRTLNEYRINGITLKALDGEKLGQIPTKGFWATVSVTNQSSSGDTLVLLGVYDEQGRYLDMMCSQVKNLSAGQTVELSLLVKNTKGDIGSIKAFLVTSLSDLTPISKAVSWQGQ